VAIQVSDFDLEPEEGLLQRDLLFHFEVVAFSREYWVRNLLDLENDISGSHVHELVRGIAEALFVAVGSSLLDEHEELVEGLLRFVSPADVASGRLNPALSSALVALSLELLDEAGGELLFLDDHTLTMALGALSNVIWIISSITSAMWANRLPSVLHFHVLAVVQVLERDAELDGHTGASLLASLATTTK